jgi:tetratricopeptide (TPR) repeat protein
MTIAAALDANLTRQVRHELERVLAAPSFAGAKGQQRLLSHLVERRLAGDTAVLKESVLGIEVFGRPADRFDPAADSIVRVEARRLRKRLARHYASGGREAPVEIVLPVGGYVPEFRPRTARAAEAPPDHAAELVARGNFFLRPGTEAGLRKALVRFTEAAELAPASADAHMGVARTWTGLIGMLFEPALPGARHAREAAERALAIDPARGDALALVASLMHRFDFDWRGAERLYRQAMALTPGSAYLHHALAFSMMVVGRFDEAEAELRIARRIEPLELSLRAHEALLQLYRRDWPATEAHLQALLDLSPESLLGRSLLGALQLYRGDAAAALACYRAIADELPALSIGWIGVAQAEALGGDAVAARRTLAELRARFDGHRWLSPYQLALVAVRLNAFDEALALLDEAGAARDCNFFCILVDPGLDPLRDDPRLAALLACHGMAALPATNPA